MYVFQSAKEDERNRIFDFRMSQILSGLILAKRIRSLVRSNMLVRQKIGYSLSAD